MSEIIKDLVDKLDNTKIVRPNIVSDNIPSDAITNTKIASNAITTAKVQDGAITTVKIADDSISNDKIKASAITTSKLDNNSVARAKIIDGSINSSKIEDGAVIASKMGFHLYRVSFEFQYTNGGDNFVALVNIITPNDTLEDTTDYSDFNSWMATNLAHNVLNCNLEDINNSTNISAQISYELGNVHVRFNIKNHLIDITNFVSVSGYEATPLF